MFAESKIALGALHVKTGQICGRLKSTDVTYVHLYTGSHAWQYPSSAVVNSIAKYAP